jgi:hypothetical protein
LRLLQNATTHLGDILRKFEQTTCAFYYTDDLPSNEAAKGPRTAKTTAQVGKGKGPRSLNLSTYKLHALGDYVKAITMFGTTEGYSTQIVSLDFMIYALIIYNHSFIK